MTFKLLIPVILLFGLMQTACSDSSSTDTTNINNPSNNSALTEQFGSVTARNTEPVRNENNEGLVIDGINEFSVDVHRALVASEPGDNAVVSGYSLATALSIAMSGTANDSRAALASLLHLDTIASAELDPAINAVDLLIESRANEDLIVRSANRLFVAEGRTLQPDFLDNIVSNYGAPVTTADFINDGPAIVEAINGWVNEQTNGLIEKLVDEVQPETVVNILNAILLDATWADRFGDRGERDFTTLAGESATVPFFGTTSNFRLSNSPDQTVIEIPYAGREIVMMLVMPTDLIGFEQSLNPATLASLDAGLQGQETNLSVPEWFIEQEIDAKQLLAPLGLPTGKMDFSAMLAEDAERLSLTKVFQKAVIEVDKDGTRAAAVTSVDVGITSVPSEPVTISFDKPFWYAIRDRETGLLLFTGRVTDPAA